MPTTREIAPFLRLSANRQEGRSYRLRYSRAVARISFDSSQLGQAGSLACVQSITVMNRCGRIDSNLSLDVRVQAGNSACMTTHCYQLYCQRIDETRNMARYYTLSIEPTLFGELAVMRSWGRIGKAGGEKSEL